MLKSKLGMLPITSIDPGERARKDYQNIEQLAADIAEHNLYHPLVVKEKADGSGYELLAGGRRLMALASLQWKDIPCNIYPPMDEYDTRCVELAENINREDLTYAERATLVDLVHKLQLEKFGQAAAGPTGLGHSMQDTAALLGMSKSTVARELKLAKAIEMIPELANCKNESQAIKLMERMEEQLIREELARRADTILSHEGADAVKRMLIDNYHVGDFFEGAKKLEAGSFHCIEVDPPYGIRLDESKKDDSGGTQNYNEVPAKSYLDFLDKTVGECKRLLMDNGWLLFWFAMHPWYNDVLSILRKNAFDVIQPAVWIKQHGQTNWPDRHLASCYEPMFYARKGNAILFKQGQSNVLNFPQIDVEKKIHPTERPISMMMHLLEMFCPPAGRVCVPFAGSGNTILAAANLGMSAVGWDLSKEYKDAYVARILEQEVNKYV